MIKFTISKNIHISAMAQARIVYKDITVLYAIMFYFNINIKLYTFSSIFITIRLCGK